MENKETLNFNIDTRAGSGNIEKLFHGSSSYGYRIGIDWKVNSQSTSSNSSNVTATVYLRTTGSGVSISSSATKNVSITINGTKYSSTCTVGIGTNTKKNLFSKTVNVGHNSDGTKTCTFVCDLGIAVTLGGTYYGTISHSGSGTFDKINLNTPPTMSGSLAVSPSGTIPENTGSLKLTWTKAGDAQGNANGYQIYRYVNGGHNATFNIDNINTTSYTDNISSFGQGTQIYYKIWAKDSYGVWSNEIKSATVTKNKFTGAKITKFSSNIAWNTKSITVTVGGASNTNGNTAIKYLIYSDDITIYNRRDIGATSETITIWRTGDATPDTPYIKFDDLKSKFRGSSFNGNLHMGVRTTNAYNTVTWAGNSIKVDLRTTPVKPTSVTITGGTALKTIETTGNKYYIPNGTDTIVFEWAGGSDNIGEPHQYRLYQILDGVATLITTVSGTTKSHSVKLPKQSTTKTLAFRVDTLTSYGNSSYKDSGAVTLHYYNPPSVEVKNVDRTDTTATATIKLKANTSIPNVNFPTRTYAGVSSGTLTNTQNDQTITASGLAGENKYSWTITLNDDTKLNATNVTAKVEIPAYTPLFSVREKGVGINAIPDGSAGLVVRGGINVQGKIRATTPDGSHNRDFINFKDGDKNGMGVAIGCGGLTVIGGGESAQTFLNAHETPASEQLHLASDTSVYIQTGLQNGVDGRKTVEIDRNGKIWTPDGEVLTKRTDGVTEVGKYIDFHDTGSTKDYDVRLQCTGSTLEVKGQMAVDSVFNVRGHVNLPNNGGSWINGATNGNLRGSKQSTGSYHPIISQTTSSNHKISLGGLGDEFGFHLYNANRTENGIDKYFRFRLANMDMVSDMRLTLNEWLYCSGAYGIYFSTHGGGLYMTDSTWIRTWGSKSIYTAGTMKADTQVQTKKIEFANDDNITYDDTNNIFNFTSDSSVNNSKIRVGHLWSGSASGAECKIAPTWSGSAGTEFSFYNTKGNGWGFIGNSGTPWYRVYGTGGSVSARERKYDISKANTEEHYENIKNINVYNYRTISNEQNEEGEVVKEFKRQDLMLGCMVDELPTETTFYDNEGGDGKAVDMYSYTTMILGGTKHLIEKVENLEKENELKDKKIEDLERRLEKMEELLNGIIN